MERRDRSGWMTIALAVALFAALGLAAGGAFLVIVQVLLAAGLGVLALVASIVTLRRRRRDLGR